LFGSCFLACLVLAWLLFFLFVCWLLVPRICDAETPFSTDAYSTGGSSAVTVRIYGTWYMGRGCCSSSWLCLTCGSRVMIDNQLFPNPKPLL
jgi:hypothetical protein